MAGKAEAKSVAGEGAQETVHALENEIRNYSFWAGLCLVCAIYLSFWTAGALISGGWTFALVASFTLPALIIATVGSFALFRTSARAFYRLRSLRRKAGGPAQ